MAIKNYTTSIKATKTVGEIQEMLAHFGAKNVSVEFSDKQPAAVVFVLTVSTKDFSFRLPANPQGVLDTMKRDNVPYKLRNLEQARNVGWRIIKDWLAAQLAIIDAGQAKPVEVFFPYLLEASGQTLFQKFENQHLQLTSGEDATKAE